ncbi:polymer-forming cytoskeletal protein [Erwinia sp. 9145]|uniref:bactofilin family protein n=1 Tax=Erwinia sp. 9145 TaxID=1500895 RepID=UPI00055679ED|nr:polymer-forming cytoskeletal protein [Erwinia sp. 9145]
MNFNLLWYVWAIWAFALIVYAIGWENLLSVWRHRTLTTVTFLAIATSLLVGKTALNKGMIMFKRKETILTSGGEPLPSTAIQESEPVDEGVGSVTVSSSIAPAMDTTTIPDTCLIAGDISAAGDIKVNGTIEGKIFSDKTVFVMKNGRVEGEIYAHRVEISGTLKGTCRSREMAINAEGFMEGIIECESLSVNQSGRFYGTSKPWKEEERPAAEHALKKRVEPLRATTDISLSENLLNF